jgi:hypothetical protein
MVLAGDAELVCLYLSRACVRARLWSGEVGGDCLCTLLIVFREVVYTLMIVFCRSKEQGCFFPRKFQNKILVVPPQPDSKK